MVEQPYHHGDLPSALLRAVGELVDEEGVAGVSLRAVARRAGVSHAAPAHHFGDRGGLLAAFAAQGFAAFTAVMVQVHADLPEGASVEDAFRAMGEAYFGFALAHPAWYRVMFRPELVDCEDPDLVREGGCAFASLLATARAGLDADATDDDVLQVAMIGWSTVHGFVSLATDVPSVEVDHLPDPVPFAAAVLDMLLAGIRSHPRWRGADVPATAVAADLGDPLVDAA